LVSALGSRLLGASRLSLYRFRHILFQKHIYGQLDPVQRAYMHQDVGSALEAIYGEHVPEIALQLAHQFSMAGLARKAVGYLQQAAERALRVSAHSEAVAHLKRALQLTRDLPEGPERTKTELGLQTSLGVSLSATRGYAAPEVEQAFNRARELCQGLEGAPPLFPVLYGLRTFYLVRADYAAAHEIGTQLLAIAEAAQDRELLVEAHQGLGTTLFYMGDLQPARAHLESCLSLYDVQRDFGHAIRYGQDPGVACHSYLSLTSWLQGATSQADEEIQRAISHAERIAHPLSMTLALIFGALLARERGRRAEARERASAAEAVSSQSGYPFWQAVATILGGILKAEEGDPEGLPGIYSGLSGWQETGAQLGRTYFTCLLALALYRSGEPSMATRIVDDALLMVQSTGERFNLAELHRVRALLLAGAGKAAEAEQTLWTSLEVARAKGAVFYELRTAIELARQLPDVARGRDVLREAYSRLPEGAEGPEVEEARRILGGFFPP
jgi:predicted ATPase